MIPDTRTRKEVCLIIACSVTFMALFVVNFVDYIAHLQEIKRIEWDVKTLTSGDYTVEVDIGVDFYQNYKRLEEKNWLLKS